MTISQLTTTEVNCIGMIHPHVISIVVVDNQMQDITWLIHKQLTTQHKAQPLDNIIS